jgi:hypothetical protein
MNEFNHKLEERKKYLDNKKKYEAKQKSDNLPELDENFEMKVTEKDDLIDFNPDDPEPPNPTAPTPPSKLLLSTQGM